MAGKNKRTASDISKGNEEQESDTQSITNEGTAERKRSGDKLE